LLLAKDFVSIFLVQQLLLLLPALSSDKLCTGATTRVTAHADEVGQRHGSLHTRMRRLANMWNYISRKTCDTGRGF